MRTLPHNLICFVMIVVQDFSWPPVQFACFTAERSCDSFAFVEYICKSPAETLHTVFSACLCNILPTFAVMHPASKQISFESSQHPWPSLFTHCRRPNSSVGCEAFSLDFLADLNYMCGILCGCLPICWTWLVSCWGCGLLYLLFDYAYLCLYVTFTFKKISICIII